MERERPPRSYMGTAGIITYSVLLVLIGVVIFQNVYGVWPKILPVPEPPVSPPAESVANPPAADPVHFYLFWRLPAEHLFSWDVRLLVIALFMGALGSWVHCVSSFVRYAGNRQLVTSWGPWYLLRPPLGAGLALIFYTILRAGFLKGGDGSLDNISHYGVAGFAALVGLFTQRASKKLAQLFDALFTPRTEDADADPLEERKGPAGGAGAPTIESISPRWLRVGPDPVTIRLTGSNFHENAVVKVDGVEVKSHRESEKKISFTLDAHYRATEGTVKLTVETAAGASRVERLPITP